MARCDHPDCTGDNRMRYTCRRCDGAFCPDHRLPENHDCGTTTFTTSSDVPKPDSDDNVLYGYLVVFAGIGLIAGLAFVLATSAPALTVPDFDTPDSDVLAGGTTPPNITTTPTSTTAPTPTSAPKGSVAYNRSAVERHFIALLNEERRSRGLQPVSQREVLTEMGTEHSQNMAEYDYVGHVEPDDGSTIEDRYRNRGLLPECRLSVEGSNRYYPGAENAANFWIGRPIETAEGTIVIENERDLARGLYVEWMNSDGHRDAMLVASADQAGLGIWITDEGEVFASLELC